MDIATYFLKPKSVSHKHYEALRMYFVEDIAAHEVASHFGYTYRAFTSLVSSFREKLGANPTGSLFFIGNTPGRKISREAIGARAVIIDMRKKYYSVPDIKVALDGLGHSVSEKNIYNIIAAEGFSRLPRRTKLVKQQLDKIQIRAEKSVPLSFENETFKSSNAGILMFLAIIKRYEIDTVIEQSNYPGTSVINKASSILCFLASSVMAEVWFAGRHFKPLFYDDPLLGRRQSLGKQLVGQTWQSTPQYAGRACP
jgi:hypothetical protein